MALSEPSSKGGYDRDVGEATPHHLRHQTRRETCVVLLSVKVVDWQQLILLVGLVGLIELVGLVLV